MRKIRILKNPDGSRTYVGEAKEGTKYASDVVVADAKTDRKPAKATLQASLDAKLGLSPGP